MLVYKFDLRACVRMMQTMSIFPATGNNFLENLSGSLIRILCSSQGWGRALGLLIVEDLMAGLLDRKDFVPTKRYSVHSDRKSQIITILER